METFSPEQQLESTQEMEISPEGQEVMNEFKEKRTGILEKVMNRKIAEMVALAAPGIDVATLLAFAARGETLNGKKLDSRSRFNHAAMGGFLALSYTLLAVGNHKEAMAMKGISATFAGMEFGPEIIKKSVDAAKEKMPSVVSFIERTGEFLEGDPELTALNLHG